MKKRLTALILAACFILSAGAFCASAETSFTPRTRLPESTEDAYKYYFDGNYNIFAKYGNGLPNCTCYAFGRAYEILGKEPSLNHHNAYEWYGYNQEKNYYLYGQTPKLGAIACWTNAAHTTGHVAVVEQITEDSVILSESWYGKKMFTMCTCNKETMDYYNTGYIFQGFIYIITDGVSTGDISDNSGDYNDFTVGEYTITATNLMIRKTASTTGDIIGSLKNGVVVTVKKLNGNWGYVTVDDISGWICLDYATPVEEKVDTGYTTGKYTITADPSINLRDSASKSSMTIGTINKGESVTVTRISGNWGYVTYDNTSGWIDLEYAAKWNSSYNPGVYRVTADPYLRIRSEAKAESAMLGVVALDNIVTVTEVKNGWGYISINGVEGWISLEYTEYRAAESAFDDVDEGVWYTDAVNFVYERELFTGVSESIFAPEIKMTRGMFVQVLSSVSGVDTNKYSTNDFSDVPSDKWYSGAVAWAYENNVASGVGDGRFCPEDTVTREQICTMLVKYASKRDISLSGSNSGADDFADSDDISLWAYKSVNAAARAGLISGKPHKLCDPQGEATRAEVAQIIMNFVTNFG